MGIAVKTTPAATSAKDEVRALLDRLPDDATLEDIEYHIMVVRKVRHAETQVERGEFVSHDEFEKQVQSWFAK
jgi:predicted transcriptional regulator